MSFVDALGQPFEPGGPADRIVSLVPSLTEAIFSMGAGDRVVGVTAYCEEPSAQVGRLPKVGGTKNPDISVIRALRPDFVVASAEENRREDVEALLQAGLRVFITLYATVRDSLLGMAALAVLVAPGVPQLWLEDAAVEAERLAVLTPPPVRYFCPIWRRPYMVARADTYMADLLALSGGVSSVQAHCAEHYCPVEPGEIRSTRPEVILLPSEPYPFAEKHVAELKQYAGVPAVQNGRIHLVDGKALTWYGPRVAGALQLFSGIFAGVAAASAPALQG